jgi:hypothetical protein
MRYFQNVAYAINKTGIDGKPIRGYLPLRELLTRGVRREFNIVGDKVPDLSISLGRKGWVKASYTSPQGRVTVNRPLNNIIGPVIQNDVRAAFGEERDFTVIPTHLRTYRMLDKAVQRLDEGLAEKFAAC